MSSPQPTLEKRQPAAPGRHCRGCGYPLEFLIESRCPECGRAFDFNDPSSYRIDDPIAQRNFDLTFLMLGAVTSLLAVAVPWEICRIIGRFPDSLLAVGVGTASALVAVGCGSRFSSHKIVYALATLAPTGLVVGMQAWAFSLRSSMVALPLGILSGVAILAWLRRAN